MMNTIGSTYVQVEVRARYTTTWISKALSLNHSWVLTNVTLFVTKIQQSGLSIPEITVDLDPAIPNLDNSTGG